MTRPRSAAASGARRSVLVAALLALCLRAGSEPSAPPAHAHLAAEHVASWQAHHAHAHGTQAHAGGADPTPAALDARAGAPRGAGGAKQRTGVPPPGVPLPRALASAAKLQPELFAALPDSFLAEYKNPCWWLPSDANGTAPFAGAPQRLRCLPYYYILGDFNCGVRDLSSRLLQHPEVVPSANAAPHWWDENKPYDDYWRLFDTAAVRIATEPAKLVVGDASTATFAFTWAGSGRTNTPWSRAMMDCRSKTCAEDKECIATKCYAAAVNAWHPLAGDGSALSTPYLMRLAMGPNIKLIVMLRDPVLRLHAAFWGGDHYLNKYGKTEEGFAQFAEDTLADFAVCAQSHTRDECVLAFEAWSQTQEDVFYHCDQLAKGAYAVFLRSWLHAFPREDVLVLRLEDYARIDNDNATSAAAGPQRAGVQRALAAVQAHLGLGAPGEGDGAVMAAAPVTRGSPPHERTPARAEALDGIRPEIVAKLRAFYDPLDRELEQLLGKPGFADWHGGQSFL